MINYDILGCKRGLLNVKSFVSSSKSNESETRIDFQEKHLFQDHF